jgi:hypothetical protein
LVGNCSSVSESLAHDGDEHVQKMDQHDEGWQGVKYVQSICLRAFLAYVEVSAISSSKDNVVSKPYSFG